jgi:hypothetical protein
MKREIFIFLFIFLFLSVIQHPDFLTSPLQRVTNLPKADAYGLGSIHPFIFSFIIYLVLYLVRLIVRGLKKIF